MKAMLLVVTGITLATVPMRASDFSRGNESLPSENFFNIPTPPVEEKVNVGGFNLVVDRTQVGYSIYPGGGNLLAVFRGDDYVVKVHRVAPGAAPEALAAKSGQSNVQVAQVRGRKSLNGMRVTYGGKPNFFSSNIHGISYYFTNPQGETICFEATQTAPHVDWSYVKYFIPDTISVARS